MKYFFLQWKRIYEVCKYVSLSVQTFFLFLCKFKSHTRTISICRIIETASATTFRNRIIRVPSRAENIDPGFDEEILQSGEIPPPMYGSSLTSIENTGFKLTVRGTTGPSGKAVLVGGAYLKNAGLSICDIMFQHVLSGTESTWIEQSSGGVWLLEWSMNPLRFHWEKKLEIQPRTFHSSILIGRSLLVFGGSDLVKNERLNVLPVNISIDTWEILPLKAESIQMVISAQSMIKTSSNTCIAIGGYTSPRCEVNELPVDQVLQCQFDFSMDGYVDSLTNFKVKALNSGPLAHNHIMSTPSETCFLISGGTAEKWAAFCKNQMPGDPCDLVAIGKCKISSNVVIGSSLVRWIACDGHCKRWFHSMSCLDMSEEEAKEAERRKNWFCRRADCKTYYKSH